MLNIKWPNAYNNSKYFILDVPTLSISIVEDALSYISTHCYYKETHKHNKFLKFPGIKRLDKPMHEPMEMENIFHTSDEKCADDVGNIDLYRFQTNPDAQDNLMECKAIECIVEKVYCVIQRLTAQRYITHKVTILFSRPFGPEQGLHTDDHRDPSTVKEEGEILVAIVALMNHTKLDIGIDRNGRKSFPIPVGAMILMSGQCVHGGSSYECCNARLHIEFVPLATHSKNTFAQNLVPARYWCPVDSCLHRLQGNSFDNKKGLYNHWNNEHVNDIKISLNKYIHAKKGGQLTFCMSCGKGLKTTKGLSQHKRHCKKR